MIKENKNQQLNPADRFDDVYTIFKTGAFQSFTQNDQTFDLVCDEDISLRIVFYTDHIVRFRYAIEGEFEADFSYAIDEAFKQDKVKLSTKDTKQSFSIIGSYLTVKVNKKDFSVQILDKKGNLLSEDAKGFEQKDGLLAGCIETSLTKKAAKNEQFFGLGDKTVKMDMRGERLENWNEDSFGYWIGTDPLYRTVPFYYSLNEGQAYGLFFDNTFKTGFDFCKEKEDTIKLYANGGEVNYYFIYGPNLLNVAERYTDLTGRPELPPYWALGFHQCRWSYFPEARVTKLADDFRAKQIPCDAIYLDIDYMDNYKCFTWNENYFPKPTEMIKSLNDKGFRVISMIDPGLKIEKGYDVYEDGKAKDMYCRRADGPIMKGPVWPPRCVFPDYTKESVRDWWGDLYKGLYVDNGMSGFWNDMNEPALFEVNAKTFPVDVRHDFEGIGASHKRIHNVYGMQMSRATYDGLKKLKPDYRPYVLTRATYAGGQRYAAVWTGDNIAAWEHIQLANSQAQRMSISGFSLIGSDIGGFAGDPDGEMMVRWLQLGIFHPVYRVHSMGFNVDGAGATDQDSIADQEAKYNKDQEPWSYGTEYTTFAKAAVEERYKLLPYLYTAFYFNATQGTPVLLPLYFFDQNDATTYQKEEEFIFGTQILVSPVSKEGETSKSVYFPKGNWYSYWNDDCYIGGIDYTIETPLNEFPCFILEGTVLPLFPVMQYTGERKVVDCDLSIYYKNGEATSHFYEDEGDGYNYENGDQLLRTFDVKGTENCLTISQNRKGAFKTDIERFKLKCIGLPNAIKTLKVDGESIDVKEMMVKASFQSIEIGF